MEDPDRVEPGMMWVQFEDGTWAVRLIACREAGGKGIAMRNVPETLPGERIEWLYGDLVPLIIKLGDHA